MRECFVCGTTEELHESHDVPCYLFIYDGNRKSQKNQANGFGRHLLCKKHHEEYEKKLNEHLQLTAKLFSKRYFEGMKKNESLS